MYEGSSDYQLVSTFMQTVVFGREIVVYENEGKVLWIMNVTTRTVKSWDPNRIPIRSHWTRKVLWLITVSESDVFLMFLNICMTTTVMHMTTTLNRPSVWFVSDIPRVEDDVSRFFEMYLKTSTMKRTEVREENTFFVNEVIGENYNQRDSILLLSLPCWMQWLTIIRGMSKSLSIHTIQKMGVSIFYASINQSLSTWPNRIRHQQRWRLVRWVPSKS